MGKPEFLLFMPHNPGDVVMALHAASELRRRIPEAAVDFITGEECLDLARHDPNLRTVSALPTSALRIVRRSGNFDGTVPAVSQWVTELENRNYEVAVNLCQGRLGALVQSFVRAERKAGYECKEGSRFEFGSRALEHLAAVPAQRDRNPFHAVDLYRLAVVEALGLPWEPGRFSPPVFELPANPSPFADRDYIVLHAGAAFRGKRWPAARWIRFAELCLAAGRRLVFTGSEEEKEFVTSIISALPPEHAAACADLAGTTTLRSAAALCRGAEHVVCGDTAIMHLAAAVRTSVVALFGPSNPVETGPYGPGHRVLQTRSVYPADLRLEEACPELDALPAEAVAHLLLEDSAAGFPAGSLWRTDWDAVLGLQILRDEGGHRHPFHDHAEPWLRLLTGDTAAEREMPLWQALRAAQSSPSHNALHKLEEEERRWAENTGASLVWEAYRIALNGLPILPLSSHLRLRAQRLRRALGEERDLDIVPRASMR